MGIETQLGFVLHKLYSEDYSFRPFSSRGSRWEHVLVFPWGWRELLGFTHSQPLCVGRLSC